MNILILSLSLMLLESCFTEASSKKPAGKAQVDKRASQDVAKRPPTKRGRRKLRINSVPLTKTEQTQEVPKPKQESKKVVIGESLKKTNDALIAKVESPVKKESPPVKQQIENKAAAAKPEIRTTPTLLTNVTVPFFPRGSLERYIDSLYYFDDKVTFYCKHMISQIVINTMTMHLTRMRVPANFVSYGSFQLGCSKISSDVDMVAVCDMKTSRKHFFTILISILQSPSFKNAFSSEVQFSFGKNLELQSLSHNYLHHAKFPIIKLEFVFNFYAGGHDAPVQISYNYDLGMVFLPLRVPLSTLQLNSILMDPNAQKKLISDLEYHSDDPNTLGVEGLFNSFYIAQATANNLHFKTFLRFLKLWAENRGLYDAQIGALNGIILNNLALYILKMYPEANAEYLVFHFFEYFAEHWNRDTQVIIREDSERGEHPNYPTRFPTFGPVIYRPVHKGKPLVDRMTKSISLLIRHELILARSLLLDLTHWQSLCTKRVQYLSEFSAWHDGSFRVSPTEDFIKKTITGVISPEIPHELQVKFARYIHSQVFKLIHLLEGTSWIVPMFPIEPSVAAVFRNTIVLYEHTETNTFTFTLLNNNNPEVDMEEWNEAFEKVRDCFLDALTSGYYYQVVQAGPFDLQLPSVMDALLFTYSHK